jgi:biotin carboxylase
MKRLLILGGAETVVPAIKKAREMGCYVITCDYRPNNPGHQFAHEYHNVSTLDKEGVLRLAQTLNLDGITAYNYDPSAPTAAFVAEKLGLPTNPYEVVETMTRKDLFRDFMVKNGFLTPRSRAVQSYEEAAQFLQEVSSACIIKPVDSCGSTGISKIESGESFQEKFEIALINSNVGLVIIEEFIFKKGHQIGGDGFLVDGELVFRCFGDSHRTSFNPLVSWALSMPTLHSPETVNRVHDYLQRVMRAASMKMGAFNFDIVVDENDQVYILEIGPRNGGNMIPELIEQCTGVNLTTYCIKAALGMDCSDLRFTAEKSYYSYFIVYCHQSGRFKGIIKSAHLESKVVQEQLYVPVDTLVMLIPGTPSRLSLLLLRFDTKEDMLDTFNRMDEHVKIHIE